ncbi:hypothetical protein, partial [Pseudomonas fluorescens]
GCPWGGARACRYCASRPEALFATVRWRCETGNWTKVGRTVNRTLFDLADQPLRV